VFVNSRRITLYIKNISSFQNHKYVIIRGPLKKISYDERGNKTKALIGFLKKNKLKKGDRLPAERYLSETLDVSRGVLREALRALEIAGIIDAKSGSGNYITSNDNFTKEIEALNILEKEDNPLNIIMVRKSIEPMAVKIAVKNATDDDIKKMLDGNLCRCTGYVQQIEAVKLAAKMLKKGDE